MESEACWMFQPIGTTSRFAAQEALTGRFQSREVPPEANLLPGSLPASRFVAQKPPLKQIAARKAPPISSYGARGGSPQAGFMPGSPVADLLAKSLLTSSFCVQQAPQKKI